MDIQTVFIAIIGVVLGAGIVWFITKKQSGIDPMQAQMLEQMQRMQEQIDRRLAEQVLATNESKEFLANRVTSVEQASRSVSMGLGKLEQATASLQKTGNEIVSFQNMLKAPKVRGSFGEVMLGNLLGDVLPSDRYEVQYPFSDTREIADAIIRLQDGYIVAVDAKFPFANYQLYIQEQNEDLKNSLRKTFIRDVKKHISDISQKYISSHEKTLDYAFMYIPIEGVYYETMVRDEDGGSLWEFCLANKVVPVSPNSFLAYLQTVLVGLRGMKIEQKTQEILQYIGTLRQDFSKFSEDFSTVGKHLSNAKTKYDDSNRRLDKLGNRFEQIEAHQEVGSLGTGE
jgi:DNA recombination protein RmuC